MPWSEAATTSSKLIGGNLHGVPPLHLRRDTAGTRRRRFALFGLEPDRKSTRLNSSHRTISYAVFCLKKKKTNKYIKSNTVKWITNNASNKAAITIPIISRSN